MAISCTYPSDVKDEEWSFVAPYLALMNKATPQREYPLRALFNALRYLAHTGCPWRYPPPIYRPGPPCISSGRAGVMRGCLNLSCMI